VSLVFSLIRCAFADKATSENLVSGTEDLQTTLDVCECIQSLQVSSVHAMSSIRRRIDSRNAGVQILAFKVPCHVLAVCPFHMGQLLDSCAKNCGNAFLEELTSKSFVQHIESLLKSRVIIRREFLSLYGPRRTLISERGVNCWNTSRYGD
jgi:hypothetical protein